MSDAAQSTAEKYPQLAKSGSAPVQVPKIDAKGALMDETDELDVVHAPDPVGHFMLVALPNVEMSKTIIVSETVTDRERAASVIGTVIAMGPDCYVDPAPKVPLAAIATGQPIIVIAPAPRFPSGPWCKIGDTVLFSRYAGKRFLIENVEFRMVNDDEITATIPVGAKVGGL